jgi:hypothetical protein
MPWKFALPEQGTSANPALNPNRWLLAATVSRGTRFSRRLLRRLIRVPP